MSGQYIITSSYNGMNIANKITISWDYISAPYFFSIHEKSFSEDKIYAKYLQ
jgi:hypothetical protein